MAGSRFKARVMNVPPPPPPPPPAVSSPAGNPNFDDSSAVKKDGNFSFTEPDTSCTDKEKIKGTH